MKNLPLLLTATGLCLFRVAAAFLTHPRFNCKEFEGQWFLRAVILDSGELTNRNIHQVHIKARGDNNLSIMVQKPEDNCKTKYFDLCMKGKPGRFRRRTQNNPVTVIETDYINFAIVGVQAGIIRALHLYSRALEVSDAVKEKFLEVVKCINFPVDQLVYLTPYADYCEPPETFPEYVNTCKAAE